MSFAIRSALGDAAAGLFVTWTDGVHAVTRKQSE